MEAIQNSVLELLSIGSINEAHALISDFVASNDPTLVGSFTEEIAEIIFQSPGVTRSDPRYAFACELLQLSFDCHKLLMQHGFSSNQNLDRLRVKIALSSPLQSALLSAVSHKELSKLLDFKLHRLFTVSKGDQLDSQTQFPESRSVNINF